MRLHAHRATAIALAGALFALAPSPARAEGLLTGFIGSTFAGDTEGGAGTFGLALAGSAAGVIGFEADLATTKDIFDDEVDIADSSVTTFMGNLVVGLGGPVRPYATAGVGVIRTAFEDPGGVSVSSNDFGMNFGGGVTGFFSEHVGLRGDVRFFRGVGDSDDLVDLDIESVDFWRGTVGVAVRW